MIQVQRRLREGFPVIVAGAFSAAACVAQEAPPSAVPVAAAEPVAVVATPAPTPTPPPPIPRLTFEVRFPAAQGGGTAAGSAGEVEYEKESVIVARGGVEVRFENTVVQADVVTLDQEAKTLVAEGKVSVTQGPQRLLGDRATFDLETKTGVFDNATAMVTDEYTFRGKTIAKTGDDTYRIEDGTFTSCSGDVPPWSFRISRADVRVEGYARVRHARMRIKNLPVLYFPYVLWPAKSDRTAGLLIPNIGTSDRKGAYLGLAYYQPFGRSYDSTFFADLYSKDFLGVGTEFRYRPSIDSEGAAEAYLMRGPLFAADDGAVIPDSEDDRWRVRWDHETRNLPFGMRGVVAYRDFSDFDFFQDFDRDRTQVALRTLYSNAFLAGSWGPHSINLLVDDRQTFLGAANGVVEQRQLPELEYRLRSSQLGKTPLYLKALASASLLEVERSATYAARYSRVDLFPELSLPLRPASWLSMKFTGGARATYYGDSICRAPTGVDDVGPEVCVPGGEQLTGETLSRQFATAGAEVVGPSLARVFATEGEQRKVKHVIEPRLVYSYLGDFDDRARVPLFDEVDTENPTNVARFSLINRVLLKASDDSAAREILSFELQGLSFDDELPFQRSTSTGETSDRSPLSAELRVAVSQRTNLRLETLYSDFLGGFLSRSVSGNVGLGQNSFGLTWYTRLNPESGVTLSDQMGVTTSLAIVPKTLRLDAQVNYDIETKELQQQRYFLNWTGSCFGIRLELREFRTSLRRDRDYRLAITLKSVGTFLDLNGGQRERF